MTLQLPCQRDIRPYGRPPHIGKLRLTPGIATGLQGHLNSANRFTHSTLLMRNGADLANRRNSAIVGPRRVSRCRRKAGFSVVGAYGRSIEASYINILHSRTCPPSLMDRRT